MKPDSTPVIFVRGYLKELTGIEAETFGQFRWKVEFNGTFIYQQGGSLPSWIHCAQRLIECLNIIRREYPDTAIIVHKSLSEKLFIQSEIYEHSKAAKMPENADDLD